MEEATTKSLNISVERSLYYEEDFYELMPTWGYATTAFVLFLIGFFGFFFNLIVILLMYKDRQLWTPLNVILLNLVCSDFSVSILGNPFTLISALHHRWIFGKTMCVIYGFFMTLLGITSITTLTVLSFERCVIVSRHLTSHRLTMKSASCTVLLIWCFSLSVTTPPLFGWGSYIMEGANISCSINWEEQTMNALTYILFLFAMGLVIPIIIITYSYMNILKTMKSNSCRMGRVAKAESQVTIMVFLMIITFMVAWTPYSIFALTQQFASRDLVSPSLSVIPALVAKSSICYNPIIYVGMNTQFRASLKRLFGFGDPDECMRDGALENTLMSPTRAISQSNTNNVTLNPENTVIAMSVLKDETTGKSSEPSAEKKEFWNKPDSDQDYDLNNDLNVDEKYPVIPRESFENIENGKFESRELLVEKNPKVQFEGIDNIGSNVWEESFLKHNTSDNHEKFYPFNKINASLRRKSYTYTNLKVSKKNDDTTKIKNISQNQKTTSGHSRKFSTTLQNIKGVTISKLVVDERDRSKVKLFEDIRSKSNENSSLNDEQMM
ncbi:vertebrate ancient opsin-like [Arctopsyche grandis]|uniref:vertebrate ancient opsin-like n=1 Tax=Arctopsyche grandis TaxID=121162 RepID=UPI00406D7F84